MSSQHVELSKSIRRRSVQKVKFSATAKNGSCNRLHRTCSGLLHPSFDHIRFALHRIVPDGVETGLQSPDLPPNCWRLFCLPRTQRAFIFVPFAFAANTVAFLSFYVAHVKCAGEDDLDMLKLLALVRWIIWTSGSRVLTASDSSGLSFLLLFLQM